MPGRPPKPTKVLKTQGTARKDRHAKRRDLELGGEAPKPPGFLKGPALEEWNRVCTIGKYAKVLSPADRGPLTIYCLIWEEVETRAQDGSFREMQGNRLTIVSNLAGKFGMTPSDRAKIQLPEDPKPTNKFAELSEDELLPARPSVQ